MLDSIMVTAVKAGFSVEEFIHYVKTDTSFYQGFKNLRYYEHDYESQLTVFKNETDTVGSLYRSGSYHINNNLLSVAVDSSYDDGRIYNRRGNYRHYTPEFFDYIFFPKDSLIVSKYARDEDAEPQTKNQEKEADAKVIIFNPGSSEVNQTAGGTTEKLAIFDPKMQPFYDYSISKETYNDSIDCYAFSCQMKSDLTADEESEVLIRELTSYFDRSTFNVLYRKYVMSYRYWLIDLDVTVEVFMGYEGEELVPHYLHYSGYWDIPFNKAEYADFKLWNYNFKLRQ